MHAFAVLADPVRRRLVEVLSSGEQSAGDLGSVVMHEFGISQPAVSNHLRLLRDTDVVTVEAAGSRRIYRLRPGALDEVTAWVERYARFWPQRLDALDTELARHRRERPDSSQPKETS